MVLLLFASILAMPPSGDHVQAIIDDMTLAHEAAPSGVPTSYDWQARPRVGLGNYPGEFKAILAWGQVYATAGVTPPSNTRVHIRNLQTFVLSKATGQWKRVELSKRVSGALYREDFVADENKPADLRDEPDGTVSIRLDRGYNFHFWGGPRVTIDPNDIAGVVTAVEARLILDDPSKPDDRSGAGLMMSCGADYWLDQDAKWDHFKTNGDVAIGRFRRIGNNWGWHYMTSLSAEALRRNPPPPPESMP